MYRLIAILLLVATSLASAKTSLEVDLGFNGRFRAGRWSPVYVTVQADKPIGGVIELHVPSASGSVNVIRQDIGVGTDKQTYALYAPLSMMDDALRATLYDRATGKPIAKWPADDAQGNMRFGLGGEQIGFMAASSGRSPMMAGFTRSNVSGPTIVTHLSTSLLPTTPIGYDSLDLLALNHPDLEAMTPQQQAAIVEWVRSGGTLLFWPGPDPLPPGPIADALPATLGDNATLGLDQPARDAAGLGLRFATIGTRLLNPRPRSATIGLLSNEATAIAGRLGLGRIVVLPIDASTLQFSSADKSNEFWNALLDPLYNVQHDQTRANYGYSADINAAEAALDKIGDIPGTGAFGFSYVIGMVAVMMLLVGPVDYFVLKKLGRQPWTWTTTAGWIGLFTAAALFAGHWLKSGDLHFRTMQLIDQADGRVIGTNEVAIVYAPRSATYGVTAAPNSWWQAVPSGQRYNSNGANFSLPLDLSQDEHGNTPGEMWIDVWNYRFLEGRTYGDGPPWVEATLSLNGDKLHGTIKNLSGHLLHSVTFHVAGYNAADINDLNDGESRDIDYTLTTPPKQAEEANNNYPTYVNGQLLDGQADVFQIDATRADGAARPPLSGSPKTIQITADSDATPDLSIVNPAAIQLHRAMYRATVDLQP